jgi:hypothetical protein
VSATTYVVDQFGTGDFPTIQVAIDAVVDGDIIELTDGSFTGDGNRDIDFSGKAITVRSQSGVPTYCVINCQGSEAEPHRGFLFVSGEGPESVLDGVGIINGSTVRYYPGNLGGGIWCSGSSPTITHCRIQECYAGKGGGAAWAECPSLEISYCEFLGNSAEFMAGALWCGTVAEAQLIGCVFGGNSTSTEGGAVTFGACSPTLIDCTFIENYCGAYGGGLTCGQSSVVLINCTFVANRATWGGGLCSRRNATCSLHNTIIAFSQRGGAVYCDYGGVASLWCCDLYGNVDGNWVGCVADQYGINGNISEDPLFCDPTYFDLTLHEDSPCAPFTPPNEECDLIGAWPVGCGPTAVRMGTWGAIKAMFIE